MVADVANVDDVSYVADVAHVADVASVAEVAHVADVSYVANIIKRIIIHSSHAYYVSESSEKFVFENSREHWTLNRFLFD